MTGTTDQCGYLCLYLAYDRIVCGGDSVEDPLDALERPLIASGDAIESLVIILQRTTAFTEKIGRQTKVIIFLCFLFSSLDVSN